MTTLHVTITLATAARLRENAEAQGISVDQYAAEVLEHASTDATLVKIMTPVYRQVAESNLSDDEIDELIRQSRKEVFERKERRTE